MHRQILRLSCAHVPVQVVFTCGAMGAGKSHVLGCACTQPSVKPDTDLLAPTTKASFCVKVLIVRLHNTVALAVVCWRACVFMLGHACSMDEANARLAARELGARGPRSLEDPPSRVAATRLREVFLSALHCLRARVSLCGVAFDHSCVSVSGGIDVRG